MNWIVDEFDYSISGVSLNLDKSSKYQSMKDSFEAEYEKILEMAKRSIKIVVGLSQPRYGVGISSALGPYSRPGTQSRYFICLFTHLKVSSKFEAISDLDIL